MFNETMSKPFRPLVSKRCSVSYNNGNFGVLNFMLIAWAQFISHVCGKIVVRHLALLPKESPGIVPEQANWSNATTWQAQEQDLKKESTLSPVLVRSTLLKVSLSRMVL